MPMLFGDFQNRSTAWDRNRLMTEAEIAEFDEFFATKTESDKYISDGFTRALAGDFSQYESVEPMMKGYLGAKKCYELYHRFEGNASNPQLQQEIKERLMEVDLRTGFALGGNDSTHPFNKFLKDCERIANRQMLIQTLEEPEPTAKLRLQNQLEREDSASAAQKMDTMLNQNLEQRVEIAKILFLNHLGKYQTYKGETSVDMDENIAEAYTHGGRTMFILPAGGNQAQVMEGIQGAQPDQSGLESRSFATHGITPRTLNKNGTIASEATEYRAKALGAYAPKKHRGMNASVGGLGQLGPNGKVITSDGTNGHMYMHLVEGKENVCGTMLVGFENAGPGQSGRLGHAHGASAKKAGNSAFLSDKSYLGNELGGRVVDLSGLNGQQLTDLLAAFEAGYRNAAQAAHTGNPSLLDACNDLLTGKQMSVGEMKGMLTKLGAQPNQISFVDQARAGYPQATDYKSPVENPAIPLKTEEQPKKKPFRVTECAGLVRPQPPKVMEKPSRLDKFLYHISFHNKHSYVSKYKRYLQELPREMSQYKTALANYERTLKALEGKQGDPELQTAYNQAVQRAEETYGPNPAAPQQQNTVVNPNTRRASPQSVARLENTFLDILFQTLNPETNSKKSLEEMQKECLDLIRGTNGYQKLVESGDAQISAVISDPQKVQNACQVALKEITANIGTNSAQPTNTASAKNLQPTVNQPGTKSLSRIN